MIYRSSRFKKQFKKLPKKIQDKISDRLKILIEDEFRSVLNNHRLSGEYSGYRSINITSDIRLVYKKDSENLYLYLVGTHSELY